MNRGLNKSDGRYVTLESIDECHPADDASMFGARLNRRFIDPCVLLQRRFTPTPHDVIVSKPGSRGFSWRSPDEDLQGTSDSVRV